MDGRLKARRKGRGVEKEQSEETRTESTDEPEVKDKFAEVRTGRGSKGPVRGGDERGVGRMRSVGKTKEKEVQGKENTEGKEELEAKEHSRSTTW